MSLGFRHEVFHLDWEDQVAPKYLSELAYWGSKSRKGDWITKEVSPKDFEKTVSLAGFVTPKSSDVWRVPEVIQHKGV